MKILKVLSKNMWKNLNLRHLDLSKIINNSGSNNIQNKGIKFLEELRSLEVLNLSSNKLSSRGIKTLCEF